jgi:hypothetical protein
MCSQQAFHISDNHLIVLFYRNTESEKPTKTNDGVTKPTPSGSILKTHTFYVTIFVIGSILKTHTFYVTIFVIGSIFTTHTFYVTIFVIGPLLLDLSLSTHVRETNL